MSEAVGEEWEAADILDRVSTEELAEQVREVRDQLADCRAEFGVESPDALTIDQTNRALAAESFVDADRPSVDTLDDISA